MEIRHVNHLDHNLRSDLNSEEIERQEPRVDPTVWIGNMFYENTHFILSCVHLHAFVPKQEKHDYCTTWYTAVKDQLRGFMKR